MITRMGIVQKKEAMSEAQFFRHWAEIHAPIVCAMSHLRRYQQNRVVERLQRGIPFAPRDTLNADGFSELWFDDLYDMQQGIGSQADAARRDLALFTQSCPVVILFKRVVIPVATEITRPLLKRITFLKRKAEISADIFQSEWLGPHAELVKTMPGVMGYHQNLILDRLIDGVSVPWADFSCDGVVEFWFDDLASLDACFASSAYARTAEHGQTFIDTMTTFLVESHSIVA